MANGDVDAINERLNGLVNLLQVVGIDGVNPNALVEEQRRAGGGATPGSNAPQSSDAHILELIKKLQIAQADSPEILAALQSPELRALASLAAQKQAAAQKAPEPARKASSLHDVMDDDDNYPKIGPGYSDDISVVSDMTTPTVMTRQQVADEEHYREVNGGPGALPPMSSLGPAQPARPSMGMVGSQRSLGAGGGGGGKTKNMVGQVRPVAARRAIAKSGGAAAQRRLNYQMAMTKLQGVPEGAASPRKVQKEVFAPASPTPSQQTPLEFPSMASGSGGSAESGGKNGKPLKSKSLKKGKKTSLAAQEETDIDFEGTDPIRAPPASTATGTNISSTRKNTPTPVTPTTDLDWGESVGWTAFDNGTTGSGDADIFVDNDGFFPNDAFASNDTFGAPPTSPSPTTKSSSRSPRPGKKSSSERPSKKPSTVGRSRKDGDVRKEKEKPQKKKSRARSSLTM
jgi:hypothetical protein